MAIDLLEKNVAYFYAKKKNLVYPIKSERSIICTPPSSRSLSGHSCRNFYTKQREQKKDRRRKKSLQLHKLMRNLKFM